MLAAGRCEGRGEYLDFADGLQLRTNCSERWITISSAEQRTRKEVAIYYVNDRLTVGGLAAINLFHD
jgi:hypothetical protein